MSQIKHRYFIALVLPTPFFEESEKLKHNIKEMYESKAALNSPSHITLHMPFEWRSDRENVLIDALMKFATGQDAIKIQFANFNCFDPRVIFIQVVNSPELNDLQHRLQRYCRREMGLFNADYKSLPFHPHVTIAFRDLKKSQFAKAWNEFRERKFEGEYLATHLTLLKHVEGRWHSFKNLDFKG